jgi:hypothetical protein
MLSKTIQDQFGTEDGPVKHANATSLVVAQSEGLPSANKTLGTAETARTKHARKSHLANVIRSSVQSEIFVRIQKNLILIKALSDSTRKARIRTANPRKDSTLALDQAIQQIKSSQRKVSKIFTPMVFRLYPEHVEAIVQYIMDVTEACASKRGRLSTTLLNEIETPKVQMEMQDTNEESKEQEMDLDSDKNETKKKPKHFQSREYYLCLSSIYLSETIEQMERAFTDEVEVQKLTRLIRPEITALENACSKIYKICYKNLPTRARKWSWRTEFKTM